MRLLPLAMIGLLLFAACQEEKRPPTIPSNIPFTPEGQLDFLAPDGTVITSINIEVAETDSARARGLMDRRQLTLEQGMLFIFPDVDDRSFWMANTPIPLDIIFVDADSQVVNIARRTKPLSREHVESTGPAQYVVEVRGGFSDRFGLTDSTRIRWRRSSS